MCTRYCVKNIKQISEKARDGKLTIEDLQGGTFTISNGGSGFDSSDVGDTIAQTGASSPSGGTGASFNITQVTGDAVTGVHLTSSLTGGTAYTADMVITLAAASSGGSNGSNIKTPLNCIEKFSSDPVEFEQ